VLRGARMVRWLRQRAARRRVECRAVADEFLWVLPAEDALQWAVPELAQDAELLQERVLGLRPEP